jgi:hypothetical protein
VVSNRDITRVEISDEARVLETLSAVSARAVCDSITESGRGQGVAFHTEAT